MMTDRPPRKVADAGSPVGVSTDSDVITATSQPGERLRRLHARRRLLREEILALAVLLLALAITVAVLATQWQGGASSSGASGSPIHFTLLLLGGGST